MDPPASLRPFFSLTQAFPPSQIIFLTLATVALYFAAFMSRPLLFVIGILPRPGADVSGFSIPTPPPAPAVDDDVPTSSEEDGEKKPFPSEEGAAKRDSLTVGKVQSTWLQTAFRTAAAVAIVLVNAWLINAAAVNWLDATACVFFSTIVALPVGTLLWNLFGGSAVTLARKADGSVSTRSIRCRDTGLHHIWMLLFWLAGYAVMPSLALASRPLFFLLPLALLGLPTQPLGQKVKLRWMILQKVAMVTFALILLGILGLWVYFAPPDNVEGSNSPEDDTPESVWSTLFQTPVMTTYWPEVLFLNQFAHPVVLLIACLYRFDRTPTPTEIAEATSGPKAAVLLPARYSEEDEGRSIAVAPMRFIIKWKLKMISEGVRPTLNYSNLAVLMLISTLAAAPILPVHYFQAKVPATLLIAVCRTVVFSLAPVFISAAVFALAWYRGEAGNLWGYEEDWGVPREESAKEASEEDGVAQLPE